MKENPTNTFLIEINNLIEVIRKEERDLIYELAKEQGLAMKNEDNFEDAVKKICELAEKQRKAA